MKVEIVAYEDGGRSIHVQGKAPYVFTAEEWARFVEVMPPKVSIQEVRPWFALFGTRTVVRWIK